MTKIEAQCNYVFNVDMFHILISIETESKYASNDIDVSACLNNQEIISFLEHSFDLHY